MSKQKSKLPFSRRSFLKMAGLGGFVTLIYSYFRGIRYPILSWEPKELASSFATDNFKIEFKNLIRTNYNSGQASFRAYAPEPSIRLTQENNEPLTVVINNIANDAKLVIDKGKIEEEIIGITRRLTLFDQAHQTIDLRWQLPELETYTFAAIGDAGGNKELEWCIQRAHQLGARFLLFLGDFNYQQSDYDNAIRFFNEAPLPCYVTVGNHDFYDSDQGLVHEQFLSEIGPLNNYFHIGKTRFINVDTAASILPYGGGQRGKLFDEIIADETTVNDCVVFTHRPLYDPMPDNIELDEGEHDIGNDGERSWLLNALSRIDATTMLCGHIHIYNRSNYQGIDSIIVGQGLGHQDLMLNEDASKMAIGQVSSDGKVNYELAPLAMPMELHCHPRVQPVKDSLMNLPHADTIRAIDASCDQDQA